MRKTFRFELWISCIASCALYNYATCVHSMVISMVNTLYIAPETYTSVARYLLAGVRRWARVQQRPLLLPWRPSHWSGLGHQLEFPGYPFWLSKRLRRTLKAQVGCETLLASGVQAGTDCQPSRGCAALSDSESARLGSGAARQRFTGILDHDLFGCSCELELTLEPPASTGGRQVGLGRKPQSARASLAEAKLGPNLKHNLEIFLGWS
jgi:hypothetical protein